MKSAARRLSSKSDCRLQFLSPYISCQIALFSAAEPVVFAIDYFTRSLRRGGDSGEGLPGATEVANSAWIESRPLRDHEALAMLLKQHPLGAGELSAILLAKECKADAVLLDDHQARQLAKREGLTVLGTVGLLEAFYVRGYLPDLNAAFRKLLAGNAYIDKRLLDRRLKLLGLPIL